MLGNLGLSSRRIVGLFRISHLAMCTDIFSVLFHSSGKLVRRYAKIICSSRAPVIFFLSLFLGRNFLMENKHTSSGGSRILGKGMPHQNFDVYFCILSFLVSTSVTLECVIQPQFHLEKNLMYLLSLVFLKSFGFYCFRPTLEKIGFLDRLRLNLVGKHMFF